MIALYDEMPAVCAKTQSGGAPDEFPDQFASKALPKMDTRRSILALDLGTKLGWATVDRNGVVRSGSVSVMPRARELPAQRWIRFRNELTSLWNHTGDFDAVYFEEVMAHGSKENPNTIAAHIYGGFLAHLETWCAGRNLTPIGLGVGQVKKAFTGNGRAKKADMIAAAEAKGFRVVDDNQADALAILSLAITRENAR